MAIEGATRAWLEISPSAASYSGAYDVLVYGTGTTSATSRVATLRVIPRGTVRQFR